MNELEAALARATRHRRSYDLSQAVKLYQEALDLVPDVDSSGLEAARITKWLGNIALWQGALVVADLRYAAAVEMLEGMGSSDTAVRLELLRCRANIAQVEDLRGRLGSARQYLVAALELDLQHEDADRVRLQLAEFQLRRKVDLVTPQRLIAQVEDNPTGLLRPNDLVARLHQVRGLLYAAQGKPGPALDEFDAVDQELGPNGDALLRAGNRHNRAAVLLTRGDVGGADRLLAEVLLFYQERGFAILRRAVRTDQAAVQLALGNPLAADKIFREVEVEYAGTPGHDLRARAYNMNGWGNAYQAREELHRAAECHTRALRWLSEAETLDMGGSTPGASRQAGVDRAQVLMNLATDHLLTYRLRYVKRARQLLDEAAQLFDGETGSPIDTGRRLTNLGVACALLGDLGAAQANFEAAATCFTGGGVLERVTANHNRGCLLALTSGQDAVGLRKALELLIPAALVRDSVRYTLDSSDLRKRWWERQATASLAESLRVAAMIPDAQLIVELILMFRLPGSLQVEVGNAPPPEARLAAIGNEHPTHWFTSLPKEAAAFEPEPTLKLAHGPRIQAPSGTEALAHYLDLVEVQYERTVRTESVVRIAGPSTSAARTSAIVK